MAYAYSRRAGLPERDSFRHATVLHHQWEMKRASFEVKLANDVSIEDFDAAKICVTIIRWFP
jgi:hypothetical protein